MAKSGGRKRRPQGCSLRSHRLRRLKPLTPTLSPATHSAMPSMLPCCTSDLKRRTNTATSSQSCRAKRPSFAARIQLNRCCELMSCRRAISATGTPALSASATIRPFSSAVQRRRRPTPVRISTRPNESFVSHIVSVICAKPSHQISEKPATSRARASRWGQRTGYDIFGGYAEVLKSIQSAAS